MVNAGLRHCSALRKGKRRPPAGVDHVKEHTLLNQKSGKVG